MMSEHPNMCHRKYCGLTTYITLEALHKLLQYTHVGEVQYHRLDRGIHAYIYEISF